MNVLIVEDDGVSRALLCQVIGERGHTVTALITAEEGWEKLSKQPFALIVLDVNLPGMSGIELCRRIRRLPHAAGSYILIATAGGRNANLVEALNAGADDYLAKPLSRETLSVRLAVAERQVRVIAARHKAENEREATLVLMQSTLDALNTHVALLDERGIIRAVNSAWKQFAVTGGLSGPGFDVGTSYIERSEMAEQQRGRLSRHFSEGLRLVLSGQGSFHMDYSCGKSPRQYWFQARVARFHAGNSYHIVVAHEDITEVKRAHDERERYLSLLQATLESTADGILAINTQEGQVSFNAKFQRMWDIPPADLPRGQQELVRALMSRMRKPGALMARMLNSIGDPTSEITDTLELLDGRILERSAMPQRIGERTVGQVWTFRDITFQRRSEEALRESENRLLNQNRVLTEMTRRQADSGQEFEFSVRDMLEHASRTLSVARSSVWLFEDDRQALRCIDLYEAVKGGHSANARILVASVPQYLEALANEETVTVNNARTDRRTAEFAGGYLQENNIGAMLDVPLKRSGSIAGVLCFEHQGETREWRLDEQNFARAVANLVSLALEASERRRAEEELKTARDAAEAASRAKSDFLANMSHELRTPLNGVIGMVDLLLNQTSDEQQQRYCQIAKSSADLLLGVINDILDFSKIEAGKLELDEVDFEIHTVVESVSLVLSRKAEEKGLELISYVDPALDRVFRGDPGRLRQVLVNLIGNAIKFTERGEVEVRCEVEQSAEHESLIRFAVRDTGVGIPSERKSRLFRSFTQIDASTTRKFGGTGLGLAISKQLVELMGGQIDLESELGKGSIFWFCAPFRHSSNSSRPAPVDLSALIGLRVLAVDDNATNRHILQEQLNYYGMLCESAEDGAAALKKLRAARHNGAPFQIAILDMDMPVLDGEALAKEIREDTNLNPIVLVLLSSVGHRMNNSRLLEMGFDACAAKPVWRPQLLDILVEALAGKLQVSQCIVDMSRERPGDSKPRAARKAGHILLVEDNDVNQDVAAGILSRAGYTLDIAADGPGAIDAVQRRVYDAILMDCQLPILDGFEATRRIREIERSGQMLRGRGHVPIVALTASALKGDRDRCLQAGMDDYLSKPLDPNMLLGVLDRLLNHNPETEAQPNPRPRPSAPGMMFATTRGMPVILEDLLQRCQGDSAFAARLLRKFAERSTHYVEQIAVGADSNDGIGMARAAHTLKGAAGNVAAVRMRQLAADIEDAARNGTLDRARACIEPLRAEVERCQRFIRQQVAEAECPASQATLEGT